VLVVSDTTAITSLLKIGRANILAGLFGDVVIPTAVRDELLLRHPNLPPFLGIMAVTDQSAVNELRDDLDLGEAEAIVLADRLQADALLIDEKRGRQVAQEHGLRAIGLAGSLLAAKKRGLIPSLADILQDLESMPTSTWRKNSSAHFWKWPASRLSNNPWERTRNHRQPKPQHVHAPKNLARARYEPRVACRRFATIEQTQSC
jgi:uncharacterized protein